MCEPSWSWSAMTMRCPYRRVLVVSYTSPNFRPKMVTSALISWNGMPHNAQDHARLTIKHGHLCPLAKPLTTFDIMAAGELLRTFISLPLRGNTPNVSLPTTEMPDMANACRSAKIRTLHNVRLRQGTVLLS